MKQICSNSQLVSVYFDREMDSPWKEKMEKHISSCSLCARQMDAYRENSLSLSQADGALLDEAQKRVLQKLETRGFYSGYGPRPVFVSPVWKRRVSIPLPAAAAVFILFALALLWVIKSPSRLGFPNMAITAETEIMPDIIPFSGVDSVLQYLGSDDADEIIILKLPESRNFASYGDPSIIKAADYSRNNHGRRKR